VKKLPQILIGGGIALIVFSIILFIFILYPVAKVEINYNLNKPKVSINDIKPIDKEFGIVIPKIGANSKIIPNVDPYNSYVYQVALTKGVAQAKGTTTPIENGNMFLFSHSSANLLEAGRYNSIFYLLSKLEEKDEIFIYYKDKRYKYTVTDKKIVDAKNVSYLTKKTNKKILTLMTCWPAGTSYKRLIVEAEIVE
jgi:sortase A